MMHITLKMPYKEYSGIKKKTKKKNTVAKCSEKSGFSGSHLKLKDPFVP